MTVLEWVGTITLILTIVGTFIVYYTKLNVKISEIQKDNNSIRKDFEEHKSLNMGTFRDFSAEMDVYRKENREDHKAILDTLARFTTVLTDYWVANK